MDAQPSIYLTTRGPEPNPVPYHFSNGESVSGPFSGWMSIKLDPLGTPPWTARLGQRNDMHEAPQLSGANRNPLLLGAGPTRPTMPFICPWPV